MKQLPKVHKDLIKTQLRSFEENPNKAEEIYDKIRVENPTIFILLAAVVYSDSSRQFKDGYCKALAQVYDLLSAQLEVDYLKE